MDYSSLFNRLEQSGFSTWANELRKASDYWFSEANHGDFKRWHNALKLLPEINQSSIDLSSAAITVKGDCENIDNLNEALSALKPWRKGPFQLSDIYIDTEWRSDFKWERVYPHLAPLAQRKILDVGCGNGYHCWRMLNDDPELVLGIDPSILFNMQFQAINHYVKEERLRLLPLTIQDMPLNMQWFDTVFSMGVLYHRRSPFDHLLQLKGLLKQGGELCLETLVIEGGAGDVLVPESRYARMNNVWFLPSTEELMHWLKRTGFKNIRVVDINQTSIEEQRSTSWMPFESLPECLDKDDKNKTTEGYPAPLRAVIIANK